MSDERDIELLADEYVLGLLDPAEHARVEAEIETDPSLRAAVAESREKFLELDLAAPPATLSEGFWSRIAAALPASLPASPSEATKPAPRPAAGNDNAAGRWRATAFAAMAASLLLAVGLGWSLVAQPDPQVVAVLLDQDGEPLVLIEDYGNAAARVTPLTEFVVPAGRAMQVWTKPSEEIGPVSLGLLKQSQSVVLEGPDLPPPHPDQLYEITIEQEGGSPTGRPTGPILVKGYAKLPR